MTNPQQTLPSMVKIESISPKIRNKTRVPTLTTTIQHSFGSFGHRNQSMCLFQLWIPLCQVVGLLHHMVVLFLVFQGISILFSIVVVLIYILTKIIRFLHPSCYIFQHLTCSQDAFSHQWPS